MGEAAALISAFVWSCTSIALASLSARTAPAVLSAIRLACGSLVLVALLLVTGDFVEYGDASGLAIAGLIISGLCGFAVGDTVYIRALSIVGIQKAFPITQAAFILLSVAGGILLLDESAGLGLFVGTPLVGIGIYLVVTRTVAAAGKPVEVPHDAVPAVIVAPPPKRPRGGSFISGGYWMLVAVGLAWATATVLLAKSRGDLGPISAGALRTPAGATGLLLLTALFQREDLAVPFRTRNHIGAIVAAGILGTAFGSLLYTYSVFEAGAARAVVLNSTAPLMAVPLAIIFLGEKFSQRIALGTVLCVAGVILVLAL